MHSANLQFCKDGTEYVICIYSLQKDLYMDSIRYAPIQFGSIWKPHSAIPNSQIIYLCNCRMQITQAIRALGEAAKALRRRLGEGVVSRQTREWRRRAADWRLSVRNMAPESTKYASPYSSSTATESAKLKFWPTTPAAS
nr:hypothetical protein Iba_chr03cCG7120 [Ipomoea batatas]